MKNHKDIFTGHESFSLREGWIVKGIDAINRRGKNIFNGNELINTIDEMGIGANMVKSLKYLNPSKVKTSVSLSKHLPYGIPPLGCKVSKVNPLKLNVLLPGV